MSGCQGKGGGAARREAGVVPKDSMRDLFGGRNVCILTVQKSIFWL